MEGVADAQVVDGAVVVRASTARCGPPLVLGPVHGGVGVGQQVPAFFFAVTPDG